MRVECGPVHRLIERGNDMAGSPVKAMRLNLLDENADYIIELLEEGQSLKTISVRLTDKLEEPISHAMVGRWCQQAGNEQRVSRARALAADHRAEGVVDRAQDLVRDVALGTKGRDDIAAVRLANDADQWIAGVWNKRYAPQTGASVTVNVGAIHLDALRAAPAVVAERPAHLALFDTDQAEDVEFTEAVSKADLF